MTQLLLKILEAHPALAVDVAKVAEIWGKLSPIRILLTIADILAAEAGDSNHPTPRAIRERLGSIRKLAGINTSIKTTGGSVKLKDITRIQSEAKDIRKPQSGTRIEDEFNDAMLPATRTPPVKNLNFIRSNFSTPFRKNGRKRKKSDSSDEEEAMSSGGSESDADAVPVPEQEPSTRSSKRRRTATMNYNIKDVRASTDDEENPQDSDDSDGGYNPFLEHEQEKAKREKRGRPHKAARLDEEDAEEA